MSIEVINSNGHIYVIVGDPDQGYNLHQLDPTPMGHWPHKYEARRFANQLEDTA